MGKMTIDMKMDNTVMEEVWVLRITHHYVVIDLTKFSTL
jgi:hypothetical protein